MGIEPHVHPLGRLPELREDRVEINVGAHGNPVENVGVRQLPGEVQEEIGLARGVQEPPARHADRLRPGSRQQGPTVIEPEASHDLIAVAGGARLLGAIQLLDEVDVAAEPLEPEQILQYGPSRSSLPGGRRDRSADDHGGGGDHLRFRVWAMPRR